MTCYVESLWSWFVCWLVWNPLWFHWTTEVIWVQVWQFDHFGDCFCTYALIIWAVPSQLASEQDSTLNMSYVYLKQRFLFAKISFWQLIATVFKFEFKLKCANGHILYAQLSTNLGILNLCIYAHAKVCMCDNSIALCCPVVWGQR
jgi:hypothetical protein